MQETAVTSGFGYALGNITESACDCCFLHLILPRYLLVSASIAQFFQGAERFQRTAAPTEFGRALQSGVRKFPPKLGAVQSQIDHRGHFICVQRIKIPKESARYLR